MNIFQVSKTNFTLVIFTLKIAQIPNFIDITFFRTPIARCAILEQEFSYKIAKKKKKVG